MQPITMSKVATTERHRCRRGRLGGTTGGVSATPGAAATCERRFATSARSRSSSARSSAPSSAASGTASPGVAASATAGSGTADSGSADSGTADSGTASLGIAASAPQAPAPQAPARQTPARHRRASSCPAQHHAVQHHPAQRCRPAPRSRWHHPPKPRRWSSPLVGELPEASLCRRRSADWVIAGSKSNLIGRTPLARPQPCVLSR